MTQSWGGLLRSSAESTDGRRGADWTRCKFEVNLHATGESVLSKKWVLRVVCSMRYSWWGLMERKRLLEFPGFSRTPSPVQEIIGLIWSLRMRVVTLPRKRMSHPCNTFSAVNVVLWCLVTATSLRYERLKNPRLLCSWECSLQPWRNIDADVIFSQNSGTFLRGCGLSTL